MKKITIDPVTRLEGHGKIDIFLDDSGEVKNTYFQIPELRGFEKFTEGRLAEDMPQITQRICGVCPEAHHMAATKALDAVFHVDPPSVERRINPVSPTARATDIVAQSTANRLRDVPVRVGVQVVPLSVVRTMTPLPPPAYPRESFTNEVLQRTVDTGLACGSHEAPSTVWRIAPYSPTIHP